MDIYKITNLINGKIYIGKTEGTYIKRFETHKHNAKAGKESYLYNAIRKYGEDNFVVDKIDEALTVEELDAKEIFWIQKLNSTDNNIGYNLTDGGTGGNTLKYLSEDKLQSRLEKIKYTKDNKSEQEKELLHQKLSNSVKSSLTNLYNNGYVNNNKGKKWYTNGIEDKMLFECPEGWWAGRTHSNINYKDVSKKLSGKTFYNNGVKEKMFIEGQQPEGWEKGRLASTCEKLSKANKGKHPFTDGVTQIFAYECPEGFKPGYSEEYISSRNNGLKNSSYKISDDTKAKISSSVKTLWEDDNYRNKYVDSHKNKIVVHLNNIEKRIPKEELEVYLNEGWVKGMSDEHREHCRKQR